MTLLEQASALGIEGFLHPVELQTLADLAPGKEVLEIGSYRGLSAWGMLQAGAKSLTSVDTHRAWTNGQTQGEEITTLQDFQRATERYADRVEVYTMTSTDAIVHLRKRRFDLIFLDAMHTYEDTLADIIRWWPCLRKGGILAGHDYRHDHFPGVEKAFDERFGPAPEGTVVVTLRSVRKG